MENYQPLRFKFHGSGGTLFGIFFLNLILIVLTLGIYYPWARAKMMQYLYGELELDRSRFQFHGTGKEMFLGFLKSILVVAVLYGLLMLIQFAPNTTIMLIALAAYAVGIVIIIPIAIHGTLRYRMSRTSYKGIHFGYRGNRNEFIKLFVINTLLTIITLGFYGPWQTVNLRKYIISHIRLGSVSLDYDGSGKSLFLLHLKGIILTIITFGLYFFIYMRDIYRFNINHILVKQNDTYFRVKTDISAVHIFVVFLATYASLLTLGLALPWVIIYNYQVFFGSISIEAGFDTNQLLQTEAEYTDATGEDLSDMLDVGLV
ncbi:MAG: YjgN family protein [Chitinophagales bacterium]|nr:YjgN family protein [Chitinophagales bacterium]